MRCALLLALMFAAPLAARQKPPKTYSIPLPARADFSSLDWLIGNWAGKTTGKSPAGEVRLSVSYTLGKRFLLLREEVSLQAAGSAPATQESWMGVLSALPGGQGFTLRMFSSTGFITRYRVSVEQATLSFAPEGGAQPPPGWLFRRTLERTGVGQIVETVDVAPPGHSFFTYYVATLAQVPTIPPPPTLAPAKPAGKPAAPPAAHPPTPSPPPAKPTDKNGKD